MSFWDGFWLKVGAMFGEFISGLIVVASFFIIFVFLCIGAYILDRIEARKKHKKKLSGK